MSFSFIGSRCRRHGLRRSSPKNPALRRSTFEALEDRRLLAFTRLPLQDFWSPTGTPVTAAAANNVDASVAVPLVDPIYLDPNLVKGQGAASASVSGAMAATVAQHVIYCPTPVGASTAVPTLVSAGAMVGAVTATSDGAQANASSGFNVIGFARFRFDDPNPLTPSTLFVGVHVAVAGAASTSGTGILNFVPANTGPAVNITGPAGANVQANYNALTGWTGGGAQAGGASDLQWFSAPITDGTEFALQITNAGLIGQAAAWGTATESGSAIFNFVTAGSIFAYAVEGTTPPPPVNGDVDGDGDVDADDFFAIAFSNSGFQRGSLMGQLSGLTIPAELTNLGIAPPFEDIERLEVGRWASVAPSNIIVVSTDDDLSDSDTSFGHLSLREALALADAQLGAETIVFAPWVTEIELSQGALAINAGNNVIIKGSGEDRLIINANGASRVFSISAGATVTISDVTITGGHLVGAGVSGSGGAIYNNGDLTIDSVVVTGNDTAWYGGAIYNHTAGKMYVVDSTFTLNSTSSTGGAIYSASYLNDALVIERSAFFGNEAGNAGAIYLSGDNGTTGTVTIRNSTFSDNHALSGSGGAISNGASAPPLTIINSTIAYNTSVAGGGGINMHHNEDNRFTLHNTILAHNDATSATTDNLNREVNSASSYNIIGYGGTSGLTDGNAGNDLLGSGVSAGLAPLGDYGGKTKTHALMVGSPALDKGSDGFAFTYDQRGIGYVRNYDLPVTDGTDGYWDIGAYEAGASTLLTVRVPTDRNNTPQNADNLSLREAISLATTLAGAENIVFAPTLYAASPLHINLSAQISIVSDVKIVGPGADKLTVDAQGGSRIFDIVQNSPTAPKVLIEGMTLTGGNAGAVRSQSASSALTLDKVWVMANAGGGVAASGTVSILNSAITNNTGGPALHLQYGTFSLGNVTISGNTSPGEVAGVYAQYGNFTFANLTVVNNVSDVDNNNAGTEAGGLLVGSSTGVSVYNSIIAGNTTFLNGIQTTADVAAMSPTGSISSSSSFNLLGSDPTALFSAAPANHNRIVSLQDIALTELGFYKSRYHSTTPVHALKFGSVAIDSGSNAYALAAGLNVDQRGGLINRFNDFDLDGDADVDIGAVELAYNELYFDL